MAYKVLRHELDSSNGMYVMEVGDGFDGQDRPKRVFSFTWPAEDERWEGLEPDAVAETQRAEVKAQLEQPQPPPETPTEPLPGVGEEL